jgi:hypothetical protein
MKKMLTHHTPRKKNERNSQRGQKTHNSKFSLLVILRRKNGSAKFCSQVLTTKSQKRGEKTQKFSFLSSLFIIHRFVFFLSFFLCGHETRILSSFRARKNRKREIERGV